MLSWKLFALISSDKDIAVGTEVLIKIKQRNQTALFLSLLASLQQGLAVVKRKANKLLTARNNLSIT